MHCDIVSMRAAMEVVRVQRLLPEKRAARIGAHSLRPCDVAGDRIAVPGRRRSVECPRRPLRFLCRLRSVQPLYVAQLRDLGVGVAGGT